jgi:serine/threonine protein kinase
MYTPGFAAPEQYKQRDRLGPWTDIYSVGATMYACMTKSPPPPADERLEKDKLQPLTKTHAGALFQGIAGTGRFHAAPELHRASAERVFGAEATDQHGPGRAFAKPTLFALIKERLTSEL